MATARKHCNMHARSQRSPIAAVRLETAPIGVREMPSHVGVRTQQIMA
jgi:hypothetical protein